MTFLMYIYAIVKFANDHVFHLVKLNLCQFNHIIGKNSNIIDLIPNFTFVNMS